MAPEAVTRGIRVLVRSQFVPERSSSEEGLYFFAYQVTIHNDGEEPVQLLSRHWVITDGMGRIEEVRGPGVVGEQPRLEPGEAFQYTSACPLPTQIGAMEGTYQMVTDEGERFDCAIPIFTLAIPDALN
jgi:ApaG protein